MPELPEVETTRRGITPHVTGRTVSRIIVREPRLRWPVSRRLAAGLAGQLVEHVGRRAKYLLLETANGTAILHLGMSGSLRIIDGDSPAGKHDHVDLLLDTGKAVRFTDPRRFGSLHWTTRPAQTHRLLRDLGPEPLDDAFSGSHLYDLSRRRRVAVKNFIMNSHVVVGIGNIYASEALYMAGIHPKRMAGRISLQKYSLLAEVVKEVLQDAIAAGGTTVRDFVDGDGKPGYFRQHLNVYGKAGEACISCRVPIREIRLGQRSTFYCPKCQK